MNLKLIMLESITIALKSQQILNKYGIYSRVEKTPKNYSDYSCGFSLCLDDFSSFKIATDILKSYNIKILGMAV